MRSVPHRVVCLLGLDDGVFPRKAPRDGDDLMLDEPHVGERDPRTEDRQLLLDALMAATDRLIVTYTGNDERTNLAAPARGAGRRAARRRSTGRCAPRRAGARAGRRPPPAAAVRPAQLHAGRARAATGRGASTASMLDGARALAGERARARRRSSPARCRRRARRCSSSTTSCASSSTPCARSCASGSGSASATTPTRSRTPCRSSSTAWRSGGSASGCSRRGWRRGPCATRRARRDRARHAAARASSGRPVIDARARRSSSRARRAARPATGDRTSLDVKVALAGRPRAQRHRPRRRRRPAADRRPTRA